MLTSPGERSTCRKCSIQAILTPLPTLNGADYQAEPCSVSLYTPPKPRPRSEMKTENENIHRRNRNGDGNKNENIGVQRETFEAKIDVRSAKPTRRSTSSLFYAQKRQSLK